MQKKYLKDKYKFLLVLILALILTITTFLQNETYKMGIYLNIFLALFTGIIIGKNFKNELFLKEKEKNVKKLQDINNELTVQKEAFAALWQETAKLNTQLFEKNKSINEQKKSYENLWAQTIALNEELLDKNAELASLNQKILDSKEKILMLNSIGEHMVSLSNINEVLTNIISLTKNILNFSTARILQYNPQKNTLEIVLAVGYSKDIAIKEITLAEGITGYAARNKKIVFVNDVSKDERYLSELAETKAEIAIPLLVKDQLIGVLDLQNNQPFIDDEEQWLLLKVLGNHTAMVLKNYQLAEDVRQRFLDIVKALVSTIEAKDLYTRGHCERVKELAIEIGQALDLDQEELGTLELAALLHDIGKIGLPESILSNKGKLTVEEYEIIKKHPLIGYEMLADISPLEPINKIILQHHERIDGKGYPNGLKGNEIDNLAKIIAVADAVDAMTSTRPYRPVQSLGYVLDQLDKHSDTQFDSKIAATAKNILLEKKTTNQNVC